MVVVVVVVGNTSKRHKKRGFFIRIDQFTQEMFSLLEHCSIREAVNN